MVRGGLTGDDLAFSLGTQQLFPRLMERMQGLWYGAATRQKLMAHLPQSLAATVGQVDFFAMSLHSVDGRPGAFVYADAGPDGSTLDAERYASFKKFSLLAGAQLLGLPVGKAVVVAGR
jgi:hypothetical protein